MLKSSEYNKTRSHSDILQDICCLLSDRAELVDWQHYSPRHWDLLAAAAKAQGVAPLAHWQIKQGVLHGLAMVPEVVRQALEKEYYCTAAANQLLYRELEKIVKALGEAEIPVVVLKGAALALTLYEDIGLRPMNDLDLLVDRSNLQQAAAILSNMSYGREPVQSERLNDRIGTQINFLPIDQVGFEVELHWSLVGGGTDHRSPDMDWFWSQANSHNAFSYDRAQALIFSPLADLLYLSAHSTLEHASEITRLVWLYDLHLIENTYGNKIDFQELISQANQNNWDRALWKAIAEVKRRFATPIEPELDRWLEKYEVREYKIERTQWSLKTEEHYYRMSALDINDRLLYVLVLLFPNPKFIERRYKVKRRWQLPFFYCIRWVELLKTIIASGGENRNK